MPVNENNTRTNGDVNQSERAADSVLQPEGSLAWQIARGVSRFFRALNHAVIAELPLADGRRCDIMAVDEKGSIAIAEIKSSIADFRADSKWPDYLQWCDRFYFATEANFPADLIPPECGLIHADRFGAEMMRASPETRLGAARRKAVMLRFARASAFRLQDRIDPDFNPGPFL